MVSSPRRLGGFLKSETSKEVGGTEWGQGLMGNEQS